MTFYIFFLLYSQSLAAHWDSPLDRAEVIINGTGFAEKLVLWQNAEECHHCSWIRSRDRQGNPLPLLAQNSSHKVWLNVKWRQRFRIAPENFSRDYQEDGYGATRFHRFYEKGVYTLNMSSKADFEKGSIPISGDKPNYAPIWTLFLILAGVQIIYSLTNHYKFFEETTEVQLEGDLNPNFPKSERTAGPEVDKNILQKPVESHMTVSKPVNPKGVKERLKSLDVFRGICLVIMMFVNYGGGQYMFFEHANWHGLTVADLVMPWFMFMMGVSFTFSMKSMIRRGFSKKEIFMKMSLRALQLLALGLFVINKNDDYKSFRVCGVLQRFFIAYVVVGGLHAFFQPNLEKAAENYPKFQDIIPYWPQWLVILVLEIVWLCLTFALPVENCPTGYLGPGGLHENSKYWNCSGGAAGYIDRKFLGEKHVYGSPGNHEVFFHDEYFFGGHKVPYDPEGILGSINSIVIVFLGLQLGKILQFYPDVRQRSFRITFWGGILICIGGGLTGLQQWDGPIPICKNLWTLSFVLTMAGWGYFVFLILYYLVDVWKIWAGAPFYFVGMNSILVYVLHEMLGGQIPFCGCEKYDDHARNLAATVGGVTTWVLYLYWLHQKKFYVAL